MASNIPQKGARAAQAVATTAMPFLYQTKTLCNNTTPLRRASLQQLLRSRPTRHCLHSSARRRHNDENDHRPLYENGEAPEAQPKASVDFKVYPEKPAPPNSPAMSVAEAADYSQRAPSYHNESMRADNARQRKAARDKAPIRKVGVKLPRDSDPQDGSDKQRFTISKLPVSGGEGKYRRLEKKQKDSDEPEDVPWESYGASQVKRRTPAVVDESFGGFGEDGMSYNPFDGDSMFAEDEGEPDFSIPAASAPGESTITLEERYTFEAIFEDIYKRTQDGTMNASGKAQARELQAKKIDPGAAKKKLASILSDGAPAEEQSQGSMADLKSYPQALRAAAAQALGLTKKATAKTAKTTKKVLTAQDEERTRERERVEALLMAAPSDIALWAVMEKEVFSLIPRLGLGVEVEKAAATAPTLKDRRTKAGKRAVAEAEKAFMEARAAAEARGETGAKDVAEVEKAKPLDMAIYGPLYPYYLVRSLQLLNSGFSKSSPLTLNVLPRIKSLGLASHILGASTPFYNELMRIYYYTYSDFKGVAKLLLEMLNSGQEMDQDTYSVVMDIVKMQSSLGRAAGGQTAAGGEGRAKGQISEGLRRLYEMPQFFGKQGSTGGRHWYSRPARVFLGWERAIRRDLEEKEESGALSSPY